MGDNSLGHDCHSACPCNYTPPPEVEVTTPLPPVIVWCTVCGGPCKGSH